MMLRETVQVKHSLGFLAILSILVMIGCATTVAGAREVPVMMPRDVGALAAKDAALMFVSEDTPVFEDGCDAISVVDVTNGEVVYRGPTMVSPGRMAMSAATGQVFSEYRHGLWFAPEEIVTGQQGDVQIYSLRPPAQHESGDWIPTPLDMEAWLADHQFDQLAAMGGIAVSDDGKDLFVSSTRSTRRGQIWECPRQGQGSLTRVAIGRSENAGLHDRQVRVQQRTRYGPHSVYTTQDDTIYVVSRGTVAANEVATAVEVFDARSLDPLGGVIGFTLKSLDPCNPYVNYSDMTPDGSVLVVNIPGTSAYAGGSGAAGVYIVDMQAREGVLHDLRDVSLVAGVAVTTSNSRHLLAVHAVSHVVLYEVHSAHLMEELSRVPVQQADLAVYGGLGYAPIEWADDATRIVVGNQFGLADDLSLYTVADDEVTFWKTLDVCSAGTRVLDLLEVQPSPTSSATPTATPTPSSTATSTTIPSPAPSTTPTVELRPVFLPVALREACVPQRVRQDVAILLDTSSSMGEVTADGRRKIEAAVEAVDSYLALLRFADGDRAAIVTFDVEARTLQRLTSDRRSLETALERVALGQRTCIPCAVRMAEAVLPSGGVSSDRTSVVVLLTDGRSNPQPVSEALPVAERLKARGVVVYTIGLGRALEVDGLRQIASTPEHYYEAPDAEDLAAVYEQIARAIPCPASSYWGNR